MTPFSKITNQVEYNLLLEYLHYAPNKIQLSSILMDLSNTDSFNSSSVSSFYYFLLALEEKYSDFSKVSFLEDIKTACLESFHKNVVLAYYSVELIDFLNTFLTKNPQSIDFLLKQMLVLKKHSDLSTLLDIIRQCSTSYIFVNRAYKYYYDFLDSNKKAMPPTIYSLNQSKPKPVSDLPFIVRNEFERKTIFYHLDKDPDFELLENNLKQFEDSDLYNSDVLKSFYFYIKIIEDKYDLSTLPRLNIVLNKYFEHFHFISYHLWEHGIDLKEMETFFFEHKDAIDILIMKMKPPLFDTTIYRTHNMIKKFCKDQAKINLCSELVENFINVYVCNEEN